MKKTYLISIKNGFLVYQPESNTVYRGFKKNLDTKYIFAVPFFMAIVTPILDMLANYICPFLNVNGYAMVKYTVLMMISGIVYYKCVYVKNKEKLLQSQLEKVNLIDIKGQVLKYTVKLSLAIILFILIVFLCCLYGLIYIGNLDKALYVASIINYVVCIPILFIESALKGRFLLIKHLLKLNKEE